jgi:hypothetical protein
MLAFKPHEKNLFGECRSWYAQTPDGWFIVEKSVDGERFQARFQGPDGRVELLQKGIWLPSFDRARDVCKEDSDRRVRARYAAKRGMRR